MQPLFTGGHPKRVPEASILNVVVVVGLSEPLHHGLIAAQGSSFVLRYLSNTVLVDIEFSTKRPQKSPVQLPPREVTIDTTALIVVPCGSSFVLVNSLEKLVSQLDTKSLKITPRKVPPAIHDRLTCVAADDPWIVVGCEDSSVTLYRNFHVFFAISLYRAAVVCCAVSEAFKAIVAVTADGFVHICSMATRRVVHSLRTEEWIPERIAVTGAWGFVVAQAARERGSVFWVWTINGRLVATLEVPFTVDAWSCWRSAQGFDYLAVASPDGDVFIAEVCYIRSLECKFQAREKVMLIEFVADVDALVVATAGRVSLVPFVPNP
jgi:hypothetical protein